VLSHYDTHQTVYALTGFYILLLLLLYGGQSVFGIVLHVEISNWKRLELFVYFKSLSFTFTSSFLLSLSLSIYYSLSGPDVYSQVIRLTKSNLRKNSFNIFQKFLCYLVIMIVIFILFLFLFLFLFI